ncbi:MAG: glycosyltransferase family 4 protein [bacterium]
MKAWIEEALHSAESGHAFDAFDTVYSAMQRDAGPYTPDEISALARVFQLAGQPDLSRMILDRLPRDQWTEDHHSLHAALGGSSAPSTPPPAPTEGARQRRQAAPPEKSTDHPEHPLRVAMISVSDSGGAGTSAYRLHLGLRAIGVESTMFVVMKRRDDPTVLVLPPDPGTGEIMDALPQDERETVWKQTTERWRRNMAPYPTRPTGLEAFTDARSTSRIDLLRGVRDADIVNLHWIAGIVDYPTLGGLLRGKASVWTLHDIHAFAGGCHYSAGCFNYRHQCGACPVLGSTREDDLSRAIWNTRRTLYEQISLDVVTPSRWLQQEAQSSTLLGKFPVHHIPYGLPLDLFQPGDRDKQRRKLGVDPEEKMILFGADSVGNLRKGFQLLVKALPELDRMLPAQERIALVTFGKEPPQLSPPNRFRVLHLGSLSGEKKIADVYSASDLFAIPSLEDNLPNTVLESLACGTPVVGFAIGGIPDMVEHKQTGYLAEPFDVKDLAQGIQWVLAQDAIGSMRESCRRRAVTIYPLERQAERYHELFRQLVRG